MPRKPSREKAPASAALILMRDQLGMTQFELAKHLHVALSTVARWESWGPPRRLALDRLTRFAKLKKLPIAATFQHLAEEDGREPPAWFRLHTDEEAQYVRATLLILREPMYAEVRPQLRRFMASFI